MTAEYHSVKESLATLKVVGTLKEKKAFAGRLVLDRFNVADRGLGAESTDNHLKHRFREFFDLLREQIV